MATGCSASIVGTIVVTLYLCLMIKFYVNLLAMHYC